MSNKQGKIVKEDNDLENYISEMKELQENQYNPGYFIGSGRYPKHLSFLSKYPLVFIILGIIGLFIVIYNIMPSKFSIPNLPGLIFEFLFSILLIYGGAVRLTKKKK